MTDSVLDGWVLGVDLGTSHTVAMLRRADGRTRPLLFDGQPLLPSAVYLDTTGRLHVGRDAIRLGQAEPGRLEPNPKRHVDAETVLLGGADVPTADLFAALLGAVAREAVAAIGFLPPAVLTSPAAWGSRRREVLTTALASAGWPPTTRLLPEPVAAARYFADVLRRPIPVGSALAVFDFGGGTLDIAVVRNEGFTPEGLPQFAVAASGGLDDLGGLDLDAALVEHLGGELQKTEAAAWLSLTEPVTLAQWRARRQFWDDVRGAKEMLSRTALAPVPVPGVEHAVHLTRDELEAAVGPLLRRGVAETETVIRAAGLAPTELAGLFLIGGSSRVPLVARLLHSELGIAPTVLEQPELPVAEGATIAVAQASRSQAAGAGLVAGAGQAAGADQPGEAVQADPDQAASADQAGDADQEVDPGQAARADQVASSGQVAGSGLVAGSGQAAGADQSGDAVQVDRGQAARADQVASSGQVTGSGQAAGASQAGDADQEADRDQAVGAGRAGSAGQAASPDHGVTPAASMRPAAVVPFADTMAHPSPEPAGVSAAAAEGLPSVGHSDAGDAPSSNQVDLAIGGAAVRGGARGSDAAGQRGSVESGDPGQGSSPGGVAAGQGGSDGNGSADRNRVQHPAARPPLLATEALEPTAAATEADVASRSVPASPAAGHAAASQAAAPLRTAGPSQLGGPQSAGSQQAAGQQVSAQPGGDQVSAHPGGGRQVSAQQGGDFSPQQVAGQQVSAHPGGGRQVPAQQGGEQFSAQPGGGRQVSGQRGGGAQGGGVQPGAEEPRYAEPVDPWATGEAAAFGNVSGRPVLHPTSGAPGSASPGAHSWLASTDPDPGVAAGAGAGLPAYKRKGFLIVAAVMVVVLGAVATVVALFWPGYPALDYQPLAGLHRVKPVVPVTSAFSAAAVRDGRAYFASVDDNGTLGVVAAAADSGRTVWTSVEAGAASRWEFFFVVPKAVVAISDADSITSHRRMVLLDPGSGKKLWERTIDADDDVLFSRDDVVLVDRREGRLVGLEIGNKGHGAWERKNPRSDYGQAGTKVVAVTTDDDFTGPASVAGVPFAESFDDDQRVVQIGVDDSARVIDAGTGDVVAGPRQSVAETGDKLIAHDGRLIVAESADARRIFSYDLAELEPKVLYTPPTANTQLNDLTPCGKDRICLVETTGYAAETAQVVAIDAAEGGVVWRRPVAGVEEIVPVGQAVLASTDTSPVQVSLLDADGRVSWTRGGVAGRLDAGNLVHFSKALSSSADDPALAGQHLGDRAVPLGSLDGIRSSTCAWDTSHLACVAAEDFVVQRFAD
jgi:hypothetical protein